MFICKLTTLLIVCVSLIMNGTADIKIPKSKLPNNETLLLADCFNVPKSSKIINTPDNDQYLNVLDYKNTDGTKSTMIFQHDIRYKDSKGSIRWKDLNITPTDDMFKKRGLLYQTKASDIIAYYPERLANDSILLKTNNHEILFNPIISDSNNITIEQNNAIYSNVNTSLICSSTFKGWQYQVVLKTNPQNNVFSQIIDFGDGNPRLNNNKIEITFPDDNETILYEPINFVDSNGKTSDTINVSIQKVENGKHIITIEENSNFLTNTDTVFPVTLTASLSDSISSTYISSASVYSSESSITHGSLTYNDIGYSSSKGFARTYLKFDLSALNDVRYDNILSAYYQTEELSHASGNTVSEIYFVKNSWTPSTITWNNMPDYYGNQKICTYNILNEQLELGKPIEYTHSIYITSAIQAWKQGVPNYGIVIKEKDDLTAKQFASEENTSYPPCLVVTYTDNEESLQAVGITSSKTYNIVNKNSGKNIEAKSLISGDSVYQKSKSAKALQTWKLTHVGNGYYSIKCNTSSACLEVKDGSTLNNASIQVGLYNGADKQLWKIIRNWDGSYRILSKVSGTLKGLSVSGSSTSDQAAIVQYTHTNNFSTQDDWTLLPTVKGTASLFGFTTDVGGVDTNSTLNLIKSFVSNMGYSTTLRTNSTKTVGLSQMQKDAVWIFSGHGNTSALSFGNNNWITAGTGYTGINYVSVSDLSNTALNSMQLGVLGACKGGMDFDSTNLPGLMYKKGAHYLSSYTKSVNVNCNNTWISNFILNLSVDFNVKEARDHADNKLYEDYSGSVGHANTRHELGDSSIRLDYSPYPSTNTASISSLAQQQNLSIRPDDSISIIPTEVNTDEKYIFINGEKTLLTKCYTLAENCLGQTFDAYTDINNNLYQFIAGTNTLAEYRPYSSGLLLGDRVVDSATALTLAENFLTGLGYHLDGFTRTNSNNFSKEFRVEYRYMIDDVPTSEKLVVYLKADLAGNVYIVDFMAYDYGSFSLAPDSSIINISDKLDDMISVQDAQLVTTLTNCHYSIDNSYLTRDSDGICYLKTLITVLNADEIPSFIQWNCYYNRIEEVLS